MSFPEKKKLFPALLKAMCVFTHSASFESKPQRSVACNVLMDCKLQFVLFLSNLIKITSAIGITNNLKLSNCQHFYSKTNDRVIIINYFRKIQKNFTTYRNRITRKIHFLFSLSLAQAFTILETCFSSSHLSQRSN